MHFCAIGQRTKRHEALARHRSGVSVLRQIPLPEPAHLAAAMQGRHEDEPQHKS